MGIAGGGELAHGGPLVSLRIIEQHSRQPVATISTSCNDESLIVWTVDDYRYPHQTQGSVHWEVKLL